MRDKEERRRVTREERRGAQTETRHRDLKGYRGCAEGPQNRGHAAPAATPQQKRGAPGNNDGPQPKPLFERQGPTRRRAAESSEKRERNWTQRTRRTTEHGRWHWASSRSGPLSPRLHDLLLLARGCGDFSACSAVPGGCRDRGWPCRVRWGTRVPGCPPAHRRASRAHWVCWVRGYVGYVGSPRSADLHWRSSRSPPPPAVPEGRPATAEKD